MIPLHSQHGGVTAVNYCTEQAVTVAGHTFLSPSSVTEHEMLHSQHGGVTAINYCTEQAVTVAGRTFLSPSSIAEHEM